MTIEDIAKVCQQANKAFCETIGDTPVAQWEEASQEEKDSMIKRVSSALENPDALPSAAEHGPHKDRAKDSLFRAVVQGLQEYYLVSQGPVSPDMDVDADTKKDTKKNTKKDTDKDKDNFTE